MSEARGGPAGGEDVRPICLAAGFFPVGLYAAWGARRMPASIALPMVALLTLFALLAYLSFPGTSLRRGAVSLGASNFLTMMVLLGRAARDRNPRLAAPVAVLLVVVPSAAVGGGLLAIAWLNPVSTAVVYLPMTLTLVGYLGLVLAVVVPEPRRP